MIPNFLSRPSARELDVHVLLVDLRPEVVGYEVVGYEVVGYEVVGYEVVDAEVVLVRMPRVEPGLHAGEVLVAPRCFRNRQACPTRRRAG